MIELQLDLFNEATTVGGSRLTGPRGLNSEDARQSIEEVEPEEVEPVRFTLSDPEGRWTITTSHVDEVKRGKAMRRLVGRCSCGWTSEFGLHSYGRCGPDRLLAHLRSHQLESRPPVWHVEAECNSWRKVRLLAGRVHCASAECHRLSRLPGRRGRDLGAEYRLEGGFGEPCVGHGGALYDRPYHWEEHDPEDHSGQPRQSFAGGLLDPRGVLWHFWCAPLEGRQLFGFLRKEERGAAADN